MLPVRTVRIGDLAEDEAVRNQMRARSQQFGRESDERLRSSQEVNERLRQMGPLPGWPEPRPSPDPMPAGQPGPVGGQGGPETPVVDRKARMQQALRKQRMKKALEARQIANGAPSLTPEGQAQGLSSTPALDAARGRPGAPMAPNVSVLGDAMKQAAEWRPSQPQAFAGKLANSATLGTADKIFALPALLPGGNTYEEAQENIRGKLGMMAEDYPDTSMAGEATGFLAPGGLMAKGVNILLKPAVNVAQRAGPTRGFLAKTANAALQGGAAGAAFGGTVGAENESIGRTTKEGVTVRTGPPGGPTLQSRLETAAAYAPGGAAFGAAMPAAGVALRPVGRAVEGAAAKVGEALRLTPGATQRFNEKIGREAVLRSLERAGILNINDFMRRAAKYGDKPVVTGELGQDPLNSLVSLVRSKGTTADKAMAVLEDRVAGLPGRMLKDISDETGMNPEDVLGAVEDMVKASRASAAPAYEASEAAPFAETANLERIVRDSPILRSLMPTAVNRVQNQAVPKIGQADQMPPIKVYDELKQLVDEEIQKRIANGVGIDDIQGIRDVLVRELDEISAEGADYLAGLQGNQAQLTAPRASPYAQAREAGGDAPKIIAGLKSGERALSGAKLAGDVEREVSQLVGGELTAYQSGVIRNLVKEVENGRLTPRRIKTQGFQRKLESVFGKPAADGLIRRFGIESELIIKGSRWNPNVGSVTSQAQMGQPSKIGDEIVRAAANTLSGNKVGLVTQAINLLRRQGYSEKQLDEIGNILLQIPDDSAKILYPGQTPTPGAIPPPIPPAGRVRQNQRPAAIPGQNGLAAPFSLPPGAPEAIGGAGGAAFGAATTPEGENPLTRAAGYGALGAGLVASRRAWGSPPIGQTQLNAFPPVFSKTLPWTKAMEKANFTPREIELTQRILQERFAGQSVEQIAGRFGIPVDSLRSKIGDLQRRMKGAGIEVDINRGTVGASMKPPPRAPVIPREQLPPKDLITAYNDGDSALNIGLDLDLPENANIANRIAVEQTRLRNVAADAMRRGNVNQLAEQWNVTPDEIQAFVAKRPRGGGFEQTISRIVETAEKAAKAGQPMQPVQIAQRLGMSPGSLNSMLSQARSGARKISDDLRQRLSALQFARGRPWGVLETPPELGGAALGGITGASAPADNPTDRLRNAGLGALLGAGAGRWARSTGNKAPGAKQGSMAAPRLADVLPDDLIEDATQESLRNIQQRYIAAGQAPPVFKTFRLPDGRVVAWRSDGDFRGGMSHDQAREVLGLGNARLEHGQFKYGDDLSKTNWYGTSGEGPAPRSVEGMMRKGVKEGRDPNDILLDATPDEIVRDLRSIGAEGPGSKVGDYPYRRKLAMGVSPTETGVKWKSPSGKDVELYGVGDQEEMVGMSIGGKTMRTPGGKPMPVSESKETFEKAFAVIEREAIRKGKDAYFFSGASQGHNRLYLGALQRLGAPQGYVAVYNRDVGSFALMRPRFLDNLIAEGKLRPSEWTIIKSKRGDSPVPDWRRKTGMFAVPPVAAIGSNGLLGPPSTKERAAVR